jgi:hypothetical protein
MDQNQALNFLAKVVDDAKLTRQERDTANLSLNLLRQLSAQFTQMVLEKRAEDEKAKAVPVKNPDAPKPTIDNIDKSTA